MSKPETIEPTTEDCHMEKREERGTLRVGEWHPAAELAAKLIQSRPSAELFFWMEAYASTAIEGNRLSEVCVETLRRFMNGQPVSDRYLLGLAVSMFSKEFEAQIAEATAREVPRRYNPDGSIMESRSLVIEPGNGKEY